MDELTLFAELRPDDRLTDTDLVELRVHLFPGLESTAKVSDSTPADEAAVLSLASAADLIAPNRSRSSRLIVAAAAVVAVGVGGLWAVANRSTGEQPIVPAAEPGVSLPATPNVYDLPLIGFTEPGWTVANAYTDDSTRSRRAVVFLSADQFDGPWVQITFQGGGTEAPAVSVPPGSGSADVGGNAADVTEIEGGAILRWSDASNRQFEAFGWGVDADQTAELVRHAEVTEAGITINDLPAGASLAEPAVSEALDRHASYQFTNTDGREVEVTLTPGGARGLYQRQGPTTEFHLEGRTAVTIGDEAATIVHYSDDDNDRLATVDTGPDTAGDAPIRTGRYRVDVQRGFWTWEFNTAGFISQQQVIDLVAGATVVDPASWQASLSDAVVAPNRRAEVIDQLLTDVPLPPVFDLTKLTAPGTDDRYQLIAEVSAAVACGWIDEWFTADAAGDTARRDQAAAALATSHDWAMLHEITDQGAWAEAAIWSYADAFNGVESTVEVTTDSAFEALGCSRSN